jgi:NAD(P)-dependent dehydrogenase (short-subunit alcohol dehydrogenase family)
MSKWALRSMNQNAAAELAQHGIVCNVYCPSPIATDMWTAIDRDLGKAAGAEQGAVTAKVGVTVVRYALTRSLTLDSSSRARPWAASARPRTFPTSSRSWLAPTART